VLWCFVVCCGIPRAVLRCAVARHAAQSCFVLRCGVMCWCMVGRVLHRAAPPRGVLYFVSQRVVLCCAVVCGAGLCCDAAWRGMMCRTVLRRGHMSCGALWRCVL
jgi:hypothetical protein